MELNDEKEARAEMYCKLLFSMLIVIGGIIALGLHLTGVSSWELQIAFLTIECILIFLNTCVFYKSTVLQLILWFTTGLSLVHLIVLLIFSY